MKYFVCFCYEEKEKTGFGNTVIEMADAVTEYKDIQEMERRLEKKSGIDHPIILDYKLLGKSVFEYVGCGDAESVKLIGSSLLFKPNISVKVSGDEAVEKSIGEIAKRIAGAISELLYQ